MSDSSMLRWRIEEQSEVIMRLKQELDENTSKLKIQEKINEETYNINKILQDELEKGDNKMDCFEKEINKIFVEFDELVKTKDQLKAKNEELQNDILKIEKENKISICAIVEEKTIIVQEKNKLIASAQVLLAKLDTQYSQLVISNEANVLNQENQLLEIIHARTKTELEKMLSDIVTELRGTSSQLVSIRSKRKKLLSHRESLKETYENENETMQLSVEETDKEIKKETSLQVQLEEQKENLEKDLASVEKLYVEEEHLINSESFIKRLTESLNDISSSSGQALKEFSAFQSHTEKLIQREQKLNERFKMLSS